MKCRPTLLILVIVLAGATGAKWVTHSYNNDDTLFTTSQRSAAGSQLALAKSTVRDEPHADQLSEQAILFPERYQTTLSPLLPNNSKLLQSNIDGTQPASNIYQLLANNGIALVGIDNLSSHLDALFAAYFDQTEADSEHAIEIILGDWAKTHPAEAWQWIQSNDTTGVLDRFRVSIIQHWLPLNADAALLAIMNLATSDEKDQLLANYAAFVAIDEPDRAFYWAYGLTNEKSRRHALDSVVYQWASSDPEQVILHLNSIVEPEIRQQMLFQSGPTITAQLAQTNPQRAMLWTSSLNKYENEFLSPIAFQQWVNKNPDEALNWLTAENNNLDSELYMSSAATTLAYQDLNVAMEVFPAMTQTVQENMASSIAFSLYQVNPNDAKVWSNNLSNQVLQNNANRGILLASVDTEPEIALAMALAYTGHDQNDVLVHTAIEVDQQHPTLLESWLLSAPLNNAQVYEIREALVRSPED